MPDLDQIMGRQAQPAAVPDGYEAVVSKTVASINDGVMVTIPAFSAMHEWGPCPWPRRGDELPEEGDRALVALSDTGQPWVTNWWGDVTNEGYVLDNDPRLEGGGDLDPVEPEKVRWVEQTGHVVAEITGSNAGTANSLAATARAPNSTETASSAVLAVNDGGPSPETRTAGVVANRAHTTGSVDAVVGGEDRRVVDEAGASDFLQLAVRAKRQINFGLDFVVWPGGDQFSTPRVVNHGLGVTPASILITPLVIPQYGFCISIFSLFGNWTSTYFRVSALDLSSSEPNAGWFNYFTWAAIA